MELAIRDPQEMDYPKLYRMLADVHLQVLAIGTRQAWGDEHLSSTDANPEVCARAIQRIQSYYTHIDQPHRPLVRSLRAGQARTSARRFG